MKCTRRLFALVAAFAVAFGALWPLVSIARAGPNIPSVICTQGGFSHGPAQPGDHDDKFHCPLCVMSVDTTLPAIVAQMAVPLDVAMAAPVVRIASFHSPLLARPPPARAPPAFS